MNLLKWTAAVAVAAAWCVARPLSGAENFLPDRVRIVGKTDKSALSYAPGEKMVFTFNAEMAGVSPEGYSLSYKRRGDDGKEFSGKVKASEPLVVETSLDKPGFVSVAVVLQDADGRIIRTKSRGRAQNIAFYAGAAVQPEKLRDCGEPADFDEFWAKQRARLDKIPFKGKVSEKLVKEEKGIRVYEVSIPCVGRPATGYLTIPADAKPGSLRAELITYGYGYRFPQIPNNPPPKIVFWLNAFGYELGRDTAYYREFFRSLRTPKYTYAFDPEENRNPETAYFNGMALRVMRALEYLKSRPEWDGRSLKASGGSQGGLQTMWAAALDPDVNDAAPSITWCCDLAGQSKAGRIHGPWRIPYTPALDYYDPVFMAKRIKKAQVDIRRAGLGDYTCPPSGLAICYHNLATPKKSIKWVQGSDHGFVPKKSEIVLWKTY